MSPCGRHTLAVCGRVGLRACLPSSLSAPKDRFRTRHRSFGLAVGTARHAPNQTLRPPVSWAPAHYRLCRCNHKASAWKMHANLADLTITASDHDLMDV